MTASINQPSLGPLLDGVYECRDGKCRQMNVSYKLMPSAKFQGQAFGMDVGFPNALDVDERRMSVKFPFADGNRRDGVGDLLEIDGIDLSRHRVNPIILWDHAKSYSLPIGLAAEWDDDAGQYDLSKYTVELDRNAQVAAVTAYFYRGRGMNGVDRAREFDHALFCEQTFDMMAKGLVRAGSIGYQVVAARELPPDYQTGTPKGLHLLNTLMLEASAVVLPANGDTVRKMLAMPKCCGKALSPYLIKSLKPYAPERKAFMATGGKAVEFDEIFIRAPKNQGEKTGGVNRQRGFIDIPDKPGYAKVYKPYGSNGAGYYYVKNETKATPVPLDEDLSETDIPPAKWKPGEGAIKGLRERKCPHCGAKWDQTAMDWATEEGDCLYCEESLTMAQHEKSIERQNRRKMVMAKGLRIKYRKAMSATTESTGGALRKPPATGEKAKKPKSKFDGYSDGDLKWNVEGLEKIVATGKDGRGNALDAYDLNRIKQDLAEIKEEIRKRGKSLETKSLPQLRKQYRTPVRRRLRKSVPGAASMYVDAKDMDAAKKLAGEKGVKFERLGETKVKLIGPDEAIDEVAKAFGRRVKAMVVGTKAIDKNRAMQLASKAKRELESMGLKVGEPKFDVITEQVSISWGTQRLAGTDADIHRRRIEVVGRQFESDDIHSQYMNWDVKAMATVKTKALPEELEDVEEKDMTDPHAGEPFGSQSLRHYRQKLMDDMQETEGHLKLLDHEPTKKALAKMQQHRADMLDEIESLHSKHYKDLPQFEDAEAKDDDEMEIEEKEMDPLGDDDGQIADSSEEEEPTPEEVIEGMDAAEDVDDPETVKRLRHRAKTIKGRRKSADDDDKKDKEEKHMCGRCAKAIKALVVEDGKEIGEEPGTFWIVNEQHGTAIDGPFKSKQEAERIKAKKEKKDFPETEPVPEEAIEDADKPDGQKSHDFADHEVEGVKGASGYLKDLSEPNSVHDEESRFKAYHYAKTLEGIGQIKESAEEAIDGAEAAVDNEGAMKRMPGDKLVIEDGREIGEAPGTFWIINQRGTAIDGPFRSEREAQAKIGHWQKSVDDDDKEEKSIPGDPDWVAEEANEPSHRKMCKDASGFLTELSQRKDFGDTHREKAAHWHKELDDLIGGGGDKSEEPPIDEEQTTEIPTPEESAAKTYEPGEMGEKDADEDDKEDKRLKRKVKALITNKVKAAVSDLGFDVTIQDRGDSCLVRTADPKQLRPLYEFLDSNGFDAQLKADGVRVNDTGYTGKSADDEKKDKEDKEKRLKRKSADDEKKDKEEEAKKLKALAESAQRSKSVLANLNKVLAGLNGSIR